MDKPQVGKRGESHYKVSKRRACPGKLHCNPQAGGLRKRGVGAPRPKREQDEIRKNKKEKPLSPTCRSGGKLRE